MEDLSNLGPRIILKIGDHFYLTETFFWGLIVAVVLIIGAFYLTRRMEKIPRGRQIVAELIVEKVYNLVEDTMGKEGIKYAPYIGTVFGFLILGNGLGLFGLRPATADINMTFAFSILTFLIIQRQGIKSYGVRGKLKEMCEPYTFMFPLKVVEQISLPISLAFRLFGNIFGGAIVMALIFKALAYTSFKVGLKVPLFQVIIPLPANLFFDVFEPVLQAFIFTMLTMVFVAMEIFVEESTTTQVQIEHKEKK
ncbi:MAG: F0F1 ATP synthase subunit A [Anaerovoracaceae bacterium]